MRRFSFSQRDRICFSILSTEEAASEFVGAYVNAANRIIGFHLLSMIGRHLAGVLSPEITVILNAMTKSHVALSEEDVAQFIRMWRTD